MKQSLLCMTVSVCALGAAPVLAQQVPFPAGNFESSPETHWTSDTSGIGNTTSFPSSGGNTSGRVSLVAVGGGSLTADVGVGFVPGSLYVVSVDIASSSLLSTGLGLGMEIRDGNDEVVAELDQSALLNLLGIDLLNVTGLTGELNLLDGALTDDLLLIGAVRDLLESLLDGSGNLIDPNLFGAIEALVNSLAGSDSSLLTRVVSLLEGVIEGEIDLGELLDPGSGLAKIGELLELDPLDPGDLVVIEDVQELVEFLLIPGNEGPVEQVVFLLSVLLGDPGDLDLVGNLLSTLLGEQDLIEGVTNILNLSMIEDLLGDLTDGDVLSLLGILNTGEGGFQNVKLLFTTGATAPSGNMQVRLKASTSLISVASVDFDEVEIQRFNLVATGTPPNGGGGGGDLRRPLVRAQLQRVVRKTTSPRIRIKGTATAFGTGNSIRNVQVAVRGQGTRPAERKFRNRVRGAENWNARVRVPVGDRTRVLFRSNDTLGRTSVTALVRVRRS